MVDGEQFIFIHQYYDVMSVNGIVVIMSDIRNLHRFLCLYVHPLALPPLLKSTFTYLGISTSFVRLCHSGLQKHSTFDKYFVWLLISSTLSTVLSEKELTPPYQMICFQYCVKGPYHIFLYCVNFEFILNQCLCDLGLSFSLGF